jgi:hypothetical protein
MLNISISTDQGQTTIWAAGSEGRNETEQLPHDHPAVQGLLDALDLALAQGRALRYQKHSGGSSLAGLSERNRT